MNRSIKTILIALLSLQLFAEDVKPPIIFLNAERLNENITRIPFEVIDQLIVVKAELLNKEGNFIIDTGSESLILNERHFSNSYPIFESNTKKSGIHSEIGFSKNKILENFKLQNFKLDKLNADVIDLSHIEKTKKMNLLGIIGYQIFKDFEIFIDLHLNQITFSKLDIEGNLLSDKVYAEKISDSIEFTLQKHTIVVNTMIGEETFKFALDTAAEFNQINKNSNHRVLKHFYPNQTLNLSGASGSKKEVLAGNLYRVRLSNSIFFGPMKTVVADLNNLKEAFGTKIDGVLGFEFFKQKRTIINYKKQKLYFIDYPLVTH